jgi:DNA-binding NarL/FixJ family response regulator
LIAERLQRDRSLEVVDASGRSVFTLATNLTAQVGIISSQLDGKVGKGFEILERLRTLVPQTRVIMLLDHDDPDSVVAAFRGGARGVFCRDNPVQLMSRCVHKVYEGQLWVSGPQLESLLEAFANAPATQLVDSQGTTLLSKREQDVVRWLAEGLTNSEIAHQLNLSENTVKNHLFRIYNKLGVSTRVEAVIYAAGQSA